MNRFTTSLWTFLLLGLATPLLPADETPATSPADAPNTPRRACRLMVNWDQSNMSGLQLTAAHRQNAPTAASV